MLQRGSQFVNVRPKWWSIIRGCQAFILGSVDPADSIPLDRNGAAEAVANICRDKFIILVVLVLWM
jgi:hypothetical protein